jgi:uncharacterized membrane protein HdeD (DUF308 family)
MELEEKPKTEKPKFIYNIVVSLLYIVMSCFFIFSTRFSSNIIAYKVFGFVILVYGIYRIYRTFKQQKNNK